MKLLGGPNGAFECESEGQRIPRKGNSIFKGLGMRNATPLREVQGKGCGERWKQEGLYVPHPPSLGSKALQDPGIRAAGKGEIPRSFSQENGDET